MAPIAIIEPEFLTIGDTGSRSSLDGERPDSAHGEDETVVEAEQGNGTSQKDPHEYVQTHMSQFSRISSPSFDQAQTSAGWSYLLLFLSLDPCLNG